MKSPKEVSRSFAESAAGKIETKTVNLIILGIMAGIFAALGSSNYYNYCNFLPKKKSTKSNPGR